ncbi:MAG: hypothetical protein VSS75_008890 [Candidatus Parabeggiatoa sp.]|nr:hypothetical protein [Candidatus Parabeggiatoa sp.]
MPRVSDASFASLIASIRIHQNLSQFSETRGIASLQSVHSPYPLYSIPLLII